MSRPIALLVAGAILLGPAAAPASDQGAVGPWDGVNPFRCTLQYAGFGATVPDPGADPYCVDFDKRRQNVDQLGVIDFLSREPARVAAAVPKCFYFQSDHWRGSIVQDDGSTKTYEWDGHYFFDKARGAGGAWVTNFNVNGHTADPGALPGIPQPWARDLGPGTGGVVGSAGVKADPACAARAAADPAAIYARPYAAPSGAAPALGCPSPSGPVSGRSLGPVRLGDEEQRVRALLGPPLDVHDGYMHYCLTGGGAFLVGQPGASDGEAVGDATAPSLVLMTTSRAYRLHGLGPGSSARAVRHRYPLAVAVARIGATRVEATRRRSPVLYGLAHGRVAWIAVYDRARLGGAATLAGYLRRA